VIHYRNPAKASKRAAGGGIDEQRIESERGFMANQPNNGGDKKPQLKVQDLETKKNPQGGGRKAGEKPLETGILKSSGPGDK
jgi:hypothetical protein